MSDVESERPERTPRRILLAEDSSVTSDLVSLVLSQRGHAVDLFQDGGSALAALGERSYHVALLDFHLPDMTGLDIVQRHLARGGPGTRPRFVAITGDVKGLLGDTGDCEVFDRVVPKPLDIDLVCDLVEDVAVPERRESPRHRPEDRAPPSAKPRPAAPRSPALDAIEALDFAFLRCEPGAAEATPVPGLQPHEHDAALVLSPGAVPSLWSLPGAHLLPVIDMTGTLGASADLDGSALKLGESGRVGDLVRVFYERRARLHRSLVLAGDLSDRLLGRILTGGGRLEPRHDGSARGLVGWNTVLDPELVASEMTKLAASGFLEETFFNRLHQCGGCGSARLIAREECPSCRSPQLEEESYLHHFRCALQAPEREFHQGDELLCPKCRRYLTHFGEDYDRPGSMVRCIACAGTASDPAVGFLCADCSAHADGDAIRTRDVMAATLTDQAVGYLEAGQSFLGLASRTLRFADLPLALVVGLNAAARDYSAEGTPFSLAYLAYREEVEIARTEGPRQAALARRQFVEVLQQALGPGATVERGSAYDFVLLPGRAPEEARTSLDRACGEASSAVRLDLGVESRVVGPEEIAA